MVRELSKVDIEQLPVDDRFSVRVPAMDSGQSML
jgi:hypothetical protein